MNFQEYGLSWRGYRIHCWRGGQGMPLLLLHGSGPGASTVGNWARVLEPLAAHFTVYAADFIGFGRTDRKAHPPYFDLKLWEEQAQFLLDEIPGEAVGVMGHSLAAVLALKLAARNPRIRGTLTTGAVGAEGIYNPNTEIIWTSPRSRADLVRALSIVVYDKSLLTEAFIDNRMGILTGAGYADYFDAMFAGDKRALMDSANLDPALLQALDRKVLLIHGLNDQLVPWRISVKLAERLPRGDVLLLNRCGHSPALERPAELVNAAVTLLAP